MAEKLPFKTRKNGKKKKDRIFEMRFELNFKNIVILLFILFMLFSMFGSLSTQNALTPTKPISTVIEDVKTQNATELEV